jgi:phospholipid/cholesterol/gamma-HCH transport system substrate-binding protein
MQDDSPDPRTSSRIAFKASLLIALFVALIGVSVFYLLFARGLFEETQTLLLQAEDSEGVSVGMDLTFSGFPIGRVRRIQLADDGTARLVIEVPTKDARWLRTSSVFTLTRGLLGNTNLRAYTGIPDDPPLPDGAERPVLTGDATSDIPRLLAETRELIGNLANFTAAGGSLANSLDNMERFTDKLAGTNGALAALVGNDAAGKQIGAALDRTNTLIARVDGLVAKADARVFGADGLAAKADTQVFGTNGLLPEARAAIVELKGALTDARESLRKVDVMLVDAQAITASARGATTDLSALRGEVDANLRKLNRMIDEVNRRWPFAREVEFTLP